MEHHHLIYSEARYHNMALQLIQSNAYEITPVLTLNAQTGTSYTPVLGDAINTLITISNAGTCTVTIPPNSSVAYPVGAVLNIARIGTGGVTFAQGAGVTIVSIGATASAPTIRARYSTVSFVQTSANNWLAFGDAA
jgi:hypothetical protein